MKKHILIVDDEPDFTHLIRCSLETDGYYEVYEENDANRAVTTAREVDPDLILLDVMMPDLDGSDVAARLREDRRFAHTPIIFLTALANGHQSSLGKAKPTGQIYLPKNSSTEQLIDCIEERLSHAAALA